MPNDNLKPTFGSVFNDGVRVDVPGVMDIVRKGRRNGVVVEISIHPLKSQLNAQAH